MTQKLEQKCFDLEKQVAELNELRISSDEDALRNTEQRQRFRYSVIEMVEELMELVSNAEPDTSAARDHVSAATELQRAYDRWELVNAAVRKIVGMVV